jgi:phospholipid transport system substrate-binding protein
MRYAIVSLAGVCLAAALAQAQAQSTPAAQAPGTPATSAPPAGSSASEGPSEVVQAAAQSMLGDLDRDRRAYQRDPAKVGQLVDKYLLPHFDVEYAARGVLGRYWATATPDQRQRFIDAFYHSLLANYGSALANFTSDKLKIYPSNVAPDATRATVRTDVLASDGDRVQVNYYMHKTPQGWKAWDVVINGISYVNSYRTDFGEQIEQQGIDSVIKRLQAGEKPEAIGKQQSGGKTG